MCKAGLGSVAAFFADPADWICSRIASVHAVVGADRNRGIRQLWAFDEQRLQVTLSHCMEHDSIHVCFIVHVFDYVLCIDV